ncbi:histidinol-phosphate transaminase [Corynebacterium uropygiale]|uniref:Histidinol-phosphate aminotransferase n=1 Tax=Corynebacterium uropygiale TaxID=1775911 RepID=A0A9X1QNR8_9CORY|nr:histidinol-phosphate transaminase [Corynebacterium uropygiale]MCF4005657.1 histidinol-phosphate transaminase [Corynebacterium uropygiale]
MIRAEVAALPAYVPGKDRPHAVKLSSNEVATCPVPQVKDAVQEALENPNRYPDTNATALKKALAEYLGLSPEQLAVGSGSSALCQQLVQVCCHDGDEVIFPWRSFEAYPMFATVHGAQEKTVALTDSQGLDLPGMIAAITDRTRLIFVCNPNNPSGSTITRQDFHEFMDAVPDDVLVALDEAYFEYNRAEDTPNAVEEIARYDNLVGMRTFSKAWGLAGLRVGYAFGNPEIIEAVNKVAPPFSVSTVSQAAAICCLEHAPEVMASTADTITQRDRAADALGAQHSQANFIWLPSEDPAKPAALAEALAEEGIIVRAYPDGLRVSITTKKETDALIAAWEKVTARGLSI